MHTHTHACTHAENQPLNREISLLIDHCGLADSGTLSQLLNPPNIQGSFGSVGGGGVRVSLAAAPINGLGGRAGAAWGGWRKTLPLVLLCQLVSK